MNIMADLLGDNSYSAKDTFHHAVPQQHPSTHAIRPQEKSCVPSEHSSIKSPLQL
jgi:hypothetical protein